MENLIDLILDTGYWILDTGIWTLDPGIWTLDLALDLAPDWSRDRPLRISNIFIWCLEAVYAASDILSLRRPRIGYARLLVARNVSNHSTILDV